LIRDPQGKLGPQACSRPSSSICLSRS
jgi:hypothetical protein